MTRAQKKRMSPISLQGQLWMAVDGKSLGGHGRIELLREIGKAGSISKAAQNMRMSYKAAWDAIDLMNNLAGVPLVERLTGGKGGGGTSLTARGEQLVSNFKIIEQEHKKFLDYLSSQSKNIADDYLLMRRMIMKTSARNQFLGKVLSVKEGAVNDEVVVGIAGGQQIVAIITHGSTLELKLKKGAEVFALIKSSSVILVAEERDVKFSARNHMSGIISRVQPGAVNTEVMIELPGGGSIAAIVTNESSKNLKLEAGKKISAIFKASSVILGVPA